METDETGWGERERERGRGRERGREAEEMEKGGGAQKNKINSKTKGEDMGARMPGHEIVRAHV